MRDRLISIAVAFILCSAPLALARDYKDHTGHKGQEFDEAVRTKREMVVTANPLATAAGAKILKAGGTAVDAMIAVQTVLGLVEPQASGIGGGAFVVYFDAKRGKLTTIDAREKAPAAATEDRFQVNGESLGFFDAWQSGLSVGVPGVPRMMEYMHERYGRLHWSRLFQPAISLARKGFEISGRTASQVNTVLGFNEADPNYSCENRLFFRDPAAFAYFANPDCTAKPEGTKVRNFDYARTLKRIARRGADAFYTGPIAEDIVAAVQSDRNPSGDGEMTQQDLADYEVVERPPVCIWYRDEYEVCGMGPPSSGAIAVGQILGILDNFDLDGLGPLDDETVHLFAQAGRLAFADRNLYVGDADFVTVPVEGMLDKDYLAERAALITNDDMGTALPGELEGFDPTAPQPASIEHGTSHVSIVDRWGNALSMTTTVESFFGNGVLVRGFLLNNQLTDFSFAPTDGNGVPIANRVQPEKRPRSSMSPTIIFGVNGHDDDKDDDGKWGRGIWGHFSEWSHHGKRNDDGDDKGNHRRQLRYLTGSPGGSRIIGFTAQSIINMIDFGLNPQAAINVPHFGNRNTSSTELEVPVTGVTSDYNRDALKDALEARNYVVAPLGGEGSGLSIIQVTDDGLLGGADKRRDGTVGGR